MDDRGQMLLLSVLVVCLCLILLTVYLTSIKAVEASEEPSLEEGTLDNVIWAQDQGVKQAAGEAGGSQWEQRDGLVFNFKSLTDRLIDDASCSMQKRGIAFSFTYNDALAKEYLKDNDIVEVEDIGGVLIKKEGTIAHICGCAYNVTLLDGSAQYSDRRVIVWA